MNAEFKIGERVEFEYYPYSTIIGFVVSKYKKYLSIKLDKSVRWKSEIGNYDWSIGYEMDFLKSKITGLKK